MTALAGRRVVVTRSASQAAPLVGLLRQRGAEVIHLPLIEVVDEPADSAALAAVDPDAFDWVVITSPNGADAFHRAHGAPRRASVAAVGAVTASRLQRCDLVPARQRAAGLLEELASRLPPGGRVLVVQAVDAAPTLVDGLRSAGHEVLALAPYRSRTVDVALSDDERAGAVGADAVLFASGSAGRAWREVVGADTPACVVAIGPQTAADLAAVGLKVDVVAADHDAVGMVRALEEWFGPTE